jgi:Leucine-rich repeat (LRR) protein
MSPPRSPRRRWLQFSLRTLLLAVTLVAGVLAAVCVYLAPYRQQRRTMAMIEQLNGTYQTADAPTWLRFVFGSDFQVVTVVNLADCDEPDEYLDAVASLPALKTLAVGGRSFADEQLARLGSIKTLTGLVLDTASVTDDGIAAVRQTLPDIEVYRSQRRAVRDYKAHFKFGDLLTQPATGFEDLREAAGAEFFDEATQADLMFERIRDDDLEFLVDFASLHHLHLNQAPISDQGLVHLRGLRNLDSLNLWGTPVGDAGLAHLEGLGNLRELLLVGTRVTDAGLEHLRELRNLTSLYLGDTPKVTSDGLAHIDCLTNLQKLWLDNTGVGDAGLSHVAKLTNLADLSLGDTSVSNAGLAHLKPLTNLRNLRLDGTRIDDAGLAELKSLVNLAELSLMDTNVSDAGLDHLKGLQGLGKLWVGGTRVTKEGIGKLRQALPTCVIDESLRAK